MRKAGTKPVAISLICCFLVVLGVFSACATGEANRRPDKQKEIFTKYASAVVSVAFQSGDEVKHVGTGFLIGPDGVFLTNHHVLTAAYPLVVKIGSDVYHGIECLHLDEQRDIAVGKIPGFKLPTVPLGDSDKLVEGEKLVVIGKPLWNETKLSAGEFSGFHHDEKRGCTFLQHTAAISPGSSGSPVFDEEGKVVGVVVGMMREGQLVNLAYPINYAQGMMASKAGCSPSLQEVVAQEHEGGEKPEEEEQPEEPQERPPEFEWNREELATAFVLLKRGFERGNAQCSVGRLQKCAEIWAQTMTEVARRFGDSTDPDVRLAMITLYFYREQVRNIASPKDRTKYYGWGIEIAAAILASKHQERTYRTVFKDFVDTSKTLAQQYEKEHGLVPAILTYNNLAYALTNEIPRVAHLDPALQQAANVFARAHDMIITSNPPPRRKFEILVAAVDVARVALAGELGESE